MAIMAQNISPSLIHEAKLGNKISIDRLSELVRDRLYAYIFRLTLDQNLTADLVQEMIIFMIQSINQLEHVDNFWGWLFRTALGKVQHHYRDQKRRKAIELSDAERRYIHHRATTDFNDGLSEMLRQELSDAVFTGMKRLKMKYRNILILRCFENLDYREIGVIMNCSELRSRVLFFRAKTSLRRQLAFHGFGKNYFLIALALFGVITTSAKASSATITAYSLEVGFTASLLAAFSTKIGIASAAIAAALAFTIPYEALVYIIPFACLAAVFLFFISMANLYGN